VIPPEQALETGNGEILIEWEYNSDIFTEETIDKMLTYYHRLLEEAITRPGKPISTLQMMNTGERERERKKAKENVKVSFNF
jgi:hypothetical protein